MLVQAFLFAMEHVFKTYYQRRERLAVIKTTKGKGHAEQRLKKLLEPTTDYVYVGSRPDSLHNLPDLKESDREARRKRKIRKGFV